MDRAAAGVARVALEFGARPGAEIMVVCGPGNNGGDGYGAAAWLRGWGLAVRVLDLAPAPPPSAAARWHRQRCEAAGGVVALHGDDAALRRALGNATLVIDALFGVGLTRALDAWWCASIAAINDCSAQRLSIDVPSGLDADTGEPRPVAVRAQATATMIAPKVGCAPGAPGAAWAGQVVEVDIGLPWSLHGPLVRRVSG